MVSRLPVPAGQKPWVVPADLHDGGGVILCSPERRRLLLTLRKELEPDRWIDGSDEVAAATVTRLLASGATAATILATPRDGRAAAILALKCRQAGVEPEVVHTDLRGSPAGMTAAGLEPEDDLELPLEAASLAAWLALDSGRPAVHRLVPVPMSAFPELARRRSPLPPGIPVAELGGLLPRFVAAAVPAASSRLLAVLAWHELGSNACEDQYAGLGLYERNAELLANIVGQPRGAG